MIWNIEVQIGENLDVGEKSVMNKVLGSHFGLPSLRPQLFHDIIITYDRNRFLVLAGG